MSKILIYGTGGHAKVVHSICANHVTGFLDDASIETYLNKPVSPYTADSHHTHKVVIAIGDNSNRKDKTLQVSHGFARVIADSAMVDDDVVIGVGSQVIHGSIIQAGVSIGDHVIVNTGAQVDHDCTIESFVHVAPNATLCGNVTVGELSLIGAGAVVLPGVQIGVNCSIGAGSVVHQDVPDNTTVIGVPAKPL